MVYNGLSWFIRVYLGFLSSFIITGLSWFIRVYHGL